MICIFLAIQNGSLLVTYYALFAFLWAFFHNLKARIAKREYLFFVLISALLLNFSFFTRIFIPETNPFASIFNRFEHILQNLYLIVVLSIFFKVLRFKFKRVQIIFILNTIGLINEGYQFLISGFEHPLLFIKDSLLDVLTNFISSIILSWIYFKIIDKTIDKSVEI